MFCSITVLPVRGGATISARWPLPIGAIRSITRGVKSLLGPLATDWKFSISIFSRSSG